MTRERKRDDADESLMAAWLASVDGLSNAEAGDLIDRTGEAVRKYRAGEWTRLEAATKRAMRAHLEAEPPPDVDGYRAGLEEAAERAEALAKELRELASATRSPEATPARLRSSARAFRQRGRPEHVHRKAE